MSYGLRTRNDNNVITIDEEMVAYVYLGKYPIDPYTGEVTFSCVGTPQLYFEVPYNLPNTGNAAANTRQSFTQRQGICLGKLQDLGGGSWKASFYGQWEGASLSARIFGQLHLNRPSGSGEPYGLRVRSSAGKLVFDSGYRMLRLAGDTYNTEITLLPDYPSDGMNNNTYDTQVNVPFDLAGKSICATSRGVVYYPYNTGGYYDVGAGYNVNTYDVYSFYSLYWANGGTLYARRISLGAGYMESTGPLVIDDSLRETVYSRLTVINNAHFP